MSVRKYSPQVPRATSLLRDTSTGLTKHGTLNIDQQYKEREQLYSTRTKYQQINPPSSIAIDERLTWDIYSKNVNTEYTNNNGNLRISNELRKQYVLFVSLIGQNLMSEIQSKDDVSHATYFILRAIYRIYKYEVNRSHTETKLQSFKNKIRKEIHKYFCFIEDELWYKLYYKGLILLLFLSSKSISIENGFDIKAFEEMIKEKNKEIGIDFDCENIALFSNMNNNRMMNKEFGKDIEYHSFVKEDTHRLLFLPPSPLITNETEEKKANEMKEHHNHEVEKFSFEWISEKAEMIALIKLQDLEEMMDIELLTLQILDIIHNPTINNQQLQTNLTDIIGFDSNSLDIISLFIYHRKKIIHKTKHMMKSKKSNNHHQSNKNMHNSKNFSFNSASEKLYAKQRRKLNKKMAKKTIQGSEHSMRILHRNDFKNKSRENRKIVEYRTLMKHAGINNIQHSSKKENITSANVIRNRVKMDNGYYEEVCVPAPTSTDLEFLNRNLKNVSEVFPDWAQVAFHSSNIKTLNAMQSECFEKAFKSNNNLLVCAPTGAGKTNVALMTVLREIGLNMKSGVLAV